jgi:pimeloyl-ACP methyl ester carboxylesterase
MSESGFLDLPGARLYWECEGAGHPLLLIHGGLGTRRMWDGQVPELAQRYRVIRYDTRGFGKTETDDIEFANRDDAVAILAHLGAATAYVMGQSRGGMIALDLALDHPERVDALIHVASGIGGYEPELPEGTPLPPWEELERLWNERDWPAVAEFETQVWVDGWGHPSTRVDPEVRRLVKGWILEGLLAEKPEGKPQPMSPPAAQRLNELRVPTLVMVGLADEAPAVASGRHLTAVVPHARLVEFPNSAHMIHLEEPERFRDEVLRFLADCPPLGR